MLAEQARVKECYNLSYRELPGLRAREEHGEQRDGQVTDGWTDRDTELRMDRDGQMTDGRTERRPERQTDRETDGQRNGRTEKRIHDRRMDRETDRQRDGRTI